MEEQIIPEEKIPNYITIKGYQLNYKRPPLKDNIFRFRCRKKGCKYFVKINEENLNKILKSTGRASRARPSVSGCMPIADVPLLLGMCMKPPLCPKVLT